ncbi:S8 family serine peptidase [Neobacillus notoginsengisoli]|uniref:S8 family serine peptidase n=1 Tax=Neobacillus notoginsengisoli TaxID=1578198 RepID=UPI001F01CF0D|nr:S8 family serine peptidase [Neobacillus notoginsengisoli]
MKRIIPLFLVFLMIFSSFAQAASPNVARKAAPKAGQTERNSLSKTVKEKNADQTYKRSDKVRVIVEVDGDPAVTYATKQGKKYGELSSSIKASLQKKAVDAQTNVKAKLQQKAIKMQYKQNFTTTFNGFSGVVEYGQIPLIEGTDGVSKVTIAHEYQRPEIKPDMKYSKAIVQAQKAWDEYGYKGEGMIVGVIDTGIDPSHKDMVLSDKAKAALTKDKVDASVAANGLRGKFYTDKVPYGYNYYDENSEILDLGPGASMHGMHVSGTVGANGDEKNGGIKGVAPEAQLLGLKVFGNDPEMPSTWSDIIIKAIDDAIKLNADVVNMSLGSTGAFVAPDDPEQVAVQRGIDNGVLMSISAGNSNHLGDGYFNTLASNPDKGVVGAPGLSTNSLQVASLENSFIDMFAATYSFDGAEAGKAPFMSASSADPNKQSQKVFEILDAGIGKPEEFAGKDFKGKYALVQRGTLTFVEKAINAQAAGAAGVIVYNNAAGYVSMATDPEIKIPQLFMLKTDGDLLKSKIVAGTKVTIEFQGDKITAVNPTADQMSSFTSWGVTPNLDLKPEITAPGGNIYSTLNDNKYGGMSGTSMAAPHVSGGSALVLERVKKDFPELTGAARVQMAKNILMNTAKVVEDKGTYNGAYMHNPYSPRRQGAGLMQLHNALGTPVVVTNKGTNSAKVELKEIKGNKATFTLEAKNYSGKAVTYNVSGNVQTDLAIGGFDSQEANGIYKSDGDFDPKSGVGEFPISFNKKQLSVPAKGTATVEVTVDLNNTEDWGYGAPLDELFENGYFVEGFVTLTDVKDENPELHVPYVGFNGDWNKPPVLDEMIYDGKDEDSFYAWTGLVTNAGKDKDGNNNYDYLGYNPADDSVKTSQIAISPNGDGVSDNAVPILSFMRNAKVVEYNIVDKDGNVLRKLKSQEFVRKNFNDGNRGAQYYLTPSAGWDGKVKNKLVADGQYFYEVSSTIDFPGKKAQKMTFPVLVDTVAPTVTAAVSGDTVTVTGTDGKGSGIAYYDILLNGKSVYGEKELPLAGDKTTYKLKEAVAKDATVEVIAHDFAGNTTKAVVNGMNDTTIPFIHVTSPTATSVIDHNDIQVTGYVKDASPMKELTVDGKAVKLVWNDKEKRYDFSTNIKLADGHRQIRIAGSDVAGNKIDYLIRDLLVDTTAPVLTVDVPSKVKKNVDKVTLKATISDQNETLIYKIDGDEVFSKEFNFENFDIKGIKETVSTVLPLNLGTNTFALELEDIAGHKTTKTVNIFRGESKYKVKFYDGSKLLKQQDVVEDTKVKAPSAPAKAGYTFIGWYKDKNLKTKFNFNSLIVADTNVYARYVKNPAAPTSVKAASSDYNKLTVSWKKVSGATGYEVYMATSKTGSYKKIATITKGSTTSFAHNKLGTGKTYYYKVKAYSTVEGKKLVSPYSSAVSGKPVPKTPSGFKTAKASSTSIKVSWSKVNGASGYEVYRSTTKGGKYSLVKSGSAQSFTNTKLKKGKAYYYKVRAYRVVNGKKVYSNYTGIQSTKL